MLNLKSSTIMLFLVVLFFSSGCNDSPSSPDLSVEKALSKITMEPGKYVLYLYEDNRLSKHEVYDDNRKIGSKEFEYNENDLLKSEKFFSPEGTLKEAYNCSYNSLGQLDSLVYVIYMEDEDPMILEYNKYYYDTQNQLIELVYYNGRGYWTVKKEYIYENNNIIKIVSSTRDGVLGEETVTYDDKVNPFFLLKDSMVENLPLSENNILSVVYTDIKTGKTTTLVNSYTYDSEGYPITKVSERYGEYYEGYYEGYYGGYGNYTYEY